MILLAFILGFPANEIVIPILIMAYLSTGTLTRFFQLGPVAGPAGFPWVDVADGGLFYSVLAYALAVLHLLPDGPKGNQKLEMDADFLCGADRHGICRVLSGGCHGPALRFGALVTANPPALCEPGDRFQEDEDKYSSKVMPWDIICTAASLPT